MDIQGNAAMMAASMESFLASSVTITITVPEINARIISSIILLDFIGTII